MHGETFSKQPVVAVCIQSVTMRVLVSPAEVVYYIPFGWQLTGTAIESGTGAHKEGELGAGFSGQHGVEFSQLAPERILVAVEKKRDFVALGIAVNNTETAVHQVSHRLHHGVAETFVVGRLQIEYFLG